MKAISFNNVRFSYEQDEREEFAEVDTAEGAFALSGVDFSVEEGEFVAVLGHNGSGKSTLARLIDGLLMPSEGKISVFGEEGTEDNLFEIRKQVGIVFQNPDNQTVASIVEDDIAFGPENVGLPREEIGKRIDFALKAVNMEEYRYSTTSRLSGGQKQRIAIAGVLALKPKIMILDESTAMLDPRGRKEVMDVVCRLNKEEKITVILITHFPEEALLAHRAVVMHAGKIVMDGKPQDILLREESLAKYFLTAPRAVRICNALSDKGVCVSRAFTAEETAENIVKAFGDKPQTCVAETSKTPLLTGDDSERGRVYSKNLSHVYNPATPFATHALNGVDLEIKSGDFFGVLGHTGSGKSTFIQHLNALIKLPTAEKKYKPKRRKKNETLSSRMALKVNGFDLTKKTTDFKELRKRVGMVFQYPEYQLFAETVFDDVAFGLKNFTDVTDKERIEKAVKDAIEMVGLDYERIKNRSPFELSGGQKRRVAIAGVIVTKPEILVLDEPAAGLDPLGKESVMHLLHKIHADWCKTVIIVSHDMDEIAENCNRAAIFVGGKVFATGTPKELFLTDDVVEKAGLDLPFTAKLLKKLQASGWSVDCDVKAEEVIGALLKTADLAGVCMRSNSEGGQTNA